MAKSAENDFAKKVKRRKIKKIIIILVVLVLIGGGIGFCVYRSKTAQLAANNTPVNLSSVTIGDIEVTITGSGTIEPNNRYEIIPMVNGEITSCNYEVGDYVEKGAVINDFDTEDADLSLEQAESQFERSTISYQDTLKKQEDLTVTAPASGVISGIDVKVGEAVTAGQQLATITDTANMKVTLPFNEAQIYYIGVGFTAVLTSSEHQSSIAGRVSHIDSRPSAQSDGTVGYNVEIEFTNPGAFSDTTVLGGEINGQISAGSGTAQYASVKTVSFDMAGDIATLGYQNGDYVNAGAVMATLSSDDLSSEIATAEKQYNEAKLSLEQQQKSMEDYHITAPISGTVITKNSKTGDTIDRTNSSVTMMVIADVSKLKFTLAIDELDIDKIQVGQEVEVTADALEDQTFTGYISEISMEGTAENGVTTYDATVTIDSPGDLKPSMNVDATVKVQSAQNVLRVPTSDITTALGKSYVFVKDDSQPADGDSGNDSDAQQPNDAPDAQQPDGTQAMPDGSADGSSPERDNVPQAPEGFKTVEIQVGIQSEDYTEVLSGLNEGDQIYQQQVETSDDSMFGMMMGGGMSGGMGGGMSGGGGAPGGGGPM